LRYVNLLKRSIDFSKQCRSIKMDGVEKVNIEELFGVSAGKGLAVPQRA